MELISKMGPTEDPSSNLPCNHHMSGRGRGYAHHLNPSESTTRVRLVKDQHCEFVNVVSEPTETDDACCACHAPYLFQLWCENEDPKQEGFASQRRPTPILQTLRLFSQGTLLPLVRDVALGWVPVDLCNRRWFIRLEWAPGSTRVVSTAVSQRLFCHPC